MSSQTEKNKCKLVTMFTLNFGFFLVELVVGVLFNSMALVADSFHMLSDVAALVVAYFAVKMSQKKWSKNTYGWARAEVLGALVNSVFLLALCFSIVIESIKRFFEPIEMKEPLVILIVGVIGLLMNLVGLCIFRDHGHSHGHSHSSRNEGKHRLTLTHSNRLTRMVNCNAEGECVNIEIENAKGNPEDTSAPESTAKIDESKSSTSTNSSSAGTSASASSTGFQANPGSHRSGADQMNIRGVFLHLLADTLGSVIVVISALVVYFQPDWPYSKYIDPAMSVLMVTLIVISVIPLLVESSLILLQSVPDHIKIDELERKLVRQVDGVIGVHELHVWQLAGDRIIATAHINCRTLEEYFKIAEKVKAVFHNAGIHSTTIQPEFSQQSRDKSKEVCYLSCSALSRLSSLSCAESTCCPPKKKDALNNQPIKSVPRVPRGP